MFKSVSLKLAAVAVAAALLAGCRSDDSYYEPHRDNNYYNEFLAVENLWLVDTQNRDSQYSSETPLVNYLNNNGNFKINWTTDYSNAYTATLYVNRYNSRTGAREIAYKECGRGKECGFTGYQYCTYTATYDIECENEVEDNFADWISPAPRNLYVILEICDRYSSQPCSVKSEEVKFY